MTEQNKPETELSVMSDNNERHSKAALPLIEPHNNPDTKVNVTSDSKQETSSSHSKWSTPVLMENTFRPLFAEFLGTTILVSLGCLLGLFSYPDRSRADPGAATLLLSFTGFIVMILIIGIGRPSGGHFNPIISIGVCCVGAMHPVMAVLYIVVQMLGAMLGALLVKAMLTPSQYEFIQGGVVLIPEGVEPLKAFAAEWLIGLTLMETALTTLVQEPVSLIGPIAVGFIIVLNILACIQISGGCMNPARAFGPAVVYGCWKDHWVYWTGSPLGAITAAVLYKLIQAPNDKRLIWKLKSE